jgi:hypothetical protein
MPRIKKPSPPEHIVVVDTTILWHEDKTVVVNPEFDGFWNRYSAIFPMKLLIPDVVRGELLFQQRTSASKHLHKANQELQSVFSITKREYSHRVTLDRIAEQVERRLDSWIEVRGAEVKAAPIQDIDWKQVISDSINRVPPFTSDPKHPMSEKGFRDYMILETVCSICRFFSNDVNIAFLCGDYTLRQAADKRLGSIESFTSYESIADFVSFIELTRKNLTERFVKSILAKAREKFHALPFDANSLIEKDGFWKRLRAEYASEIENPVATDDFLSFLDVGKKAWNHAGEEKIWVTRPQFQQLEGENIYHWNSRVTFVRMYERVTTLPGVLPAASDRRLMIFPIDVHWKAQVRSDGRFFECEIVDWKKSDSSFKAPSEGELERWGLQGKGESPPPAGAETRDR